MKVNCRYKSSIYVSWIRYQKGWTLRPWRGIGGHPVLHLKGQRIDDNEGGWHYTNSWKRRVAKGKGEKETYTHSNAEFQIIARRDNKASLSNWCKEIKENNRMGKTRDLFKKTRDTKGTFHAKMGSIKDRNDMGLTEAEILRRGGKKYTELYKTIFMTQITTMVWSRHPGMWNQVGLRKHHFKQN